MGKIKNIRNVNKEFALNYYISKNKNIIESIIDKKIESVELEKYFYGNRKIDIFCKCSESDNNIYIESQITTSDTNHLEYVKGLVDSVDEGSIIIWIAPNFQKSHTNDIEMLMKNIGNKVELYLLEVDFQLLDTLKAISERHVLKITKDIEDLIVKDKDISILKKWGEVKSLDKLINLRKKSIRVYRNKKIIKKLREESSYINAFKEKRDLDRNAIQIGAGRNSVEFVITYENSKSESYVGCRFTHVNKDIFDRILDSKNKLVEKLDTEVVFEKENLFIKLPYVENLQSQNKIDWLVEYTNKLIFYLVNYTFYYNTTVQNEMWEEHKEGII